MENINKKIILKVDRMYNNFFLTKIRYDKMCEDGMQRTVTEEYLVDALSWTEAEKRITEEMKAFISGEFSISDIRRYRINESFLNQPGDRFFKAKLYFITLDEKSGREKKTASYSLIQAKDIEEAKDIIVREMKKTMIDYTIQKIEETKILDVFVYHKEKKD